MDEDREVALDEKARRFVIEVDGQLAFLQYQDTTSGRVLVHTEVPRVLEGRGLGGRLARAALEQARASGLKVVPSCPFVATYIRKHPEFQDLVNRRGGASTEHS